MSFQHTDTPLPTLKRRCKKCSNSFFENSLKRFKERSKGLGLGFCIQKKLFDPGILIEYFLWAFEKIVFFLLLNFVAWKSRKIERTYKIFYDEALAFVRGNTRVKVM